MDRRSGSALRALVGPLAFAGLLLAGWLVGRHLEQRAGDAGYALVETDRFAFQVGDAAPGWETWIDPRWEQLLADRLAMVGDFPADDPAGPRAVAEALAELSFVEAFEAPRVLWPDGLEVPLRLRRPVACVAWRGSFFPVAVDRPAGGPPRGVLLPGGGSTPPAFGGGFLPVLGGLGEGLEGVWLEDPALVAALSVADSLWHHLPPDAHERLGRVVIDASRDHLASLDEPGTRLELEGGRLVWWGRSPAQGAAGELPAATKWANLAEALALLDEVDWTLVDLRWDQPDILRR